MSGVKFPKGYGKWFLKFSGPECDGQDGRHTSRTLADRDRVAHKKSSKSADRTKQHRLTPS